jgi:D-galactose 1-dehydrogenase
MRPLRIAIIGFGKIAGDQHVPAIEANSRLELAATSSRSGAGVDPVFTDWRELLRQVKGLDAVAITTPPSVRYEIASECIAAGLNVLLEKPPTDTLGEVEDLACLADAKPVSLFATWHAQHNPAVDAAAKALAGKRIEAMDIVWHEDVHKWHPGQKWIWEPGGFGVFDPGINAFSIAVRIFPGSLFVRSADLHFPANAQTPIAAEIELASPVADGPLRCSLDWRKSKGEDWSIRIRTGDGQEVLLKDGGARLLIDGEERPCERAGEYPDLYREFVKLIDERRSSVDVRPLRMVADALLVARRHTTEPVQLD